MKRAEFSIVMFGTLDVDDEKMPDGVRAIVHGVIAEKVKPVMKDNGVNVTQVSVSVTHLTKKR